MWAMGGKFIFTSESREQINEVFSLNVHFINNNLFQEFFFSSKNLEQNHEMVILRS